MILRNVPVIKTTLSPKFQRLLLPCKLRKLSSSDLSQLSSLRTVTLSKKSTKKLSPVRRKTLIRSSKRKPTKKTRIYLSLTLVTTRPCPTRQSRRVLQWDTIKLKLRKKTQKQRQTGQKPKSLRKSLKYRRTSSAIYRMSREGS